MLRRPASALGLLLTTAVAVWGVVDTRGLGRVAQDYVSLAFATRGWFVMALMSAIVLTALALAFSRYGNLRLGRDDERPEFPTVTWLTMMFAAGMGVGLLYWSAAEPLSHFLVAIDYMPREEAARKSLFITNFHWGIHAWAMFGLSGLALAYALFRRGAPQLMSAPLRVAFGDRKWTRGVGSLVDTLSIYAVGIGVAGTIGMGVFQLRDGVQILLGTSGADGVLTTGIFVVLVIGFLVPLTADLGEGMGRLSNLALAITIGLLVFVLLAAPTERVMSTVLDAFGAYLAGAIPQGFRTYSFLDDAVQTWFADWTLTYMVWWISWAPFVGAFIARISRGRTIREYLLAVMFLPTLLSLFWYGVFGSVAFEDTLRGSGELQNTVETAIDSVTFVLLAQYPGSMVTQAAVVVAGFLFTVTSVVSASLVLAMFAEGGDPNPGVRQKLTWGVVVGALGLAMILAGDIVVVRSIIVMAALPFVFILPLLFMSLLRALRLYESGSTVRDDTRPESP